MQRYEGFAAVSTFHLAEKKYTLHVLLTYESSNEILFTVWRLWNQKSHLYHYSKKFTEEMKGKNTRMWIVVVFIVGIRWFSFSTLYFSHFFSNFLQSVHDDFSKQQTFWVNTTHKCIHKHTRKILKLVEHFQGLFFFPGKESSLDVLTMICANIMQNKAFHQHIFHRVDTYWNNFASCSL